ncbi:MAG: hypothetical protein IKF17_01335 [Clostridia bacterium]|nr:hypothetical protein [Clostridia bacterium]
MDAHELAEKLKNTQPKTVEALEEVVKWCSDNADNLNIGDSDQKYLYTMATKYLMQIKIGRWNDDDAKVAVHTLAKMSASEMDIDEEVAVKILSDEEYQAMARSKTSRAVCVNHGDDTYTVVYSPKVIEQLKSNHQDDFLDGLQTVFHEVVHAQQGSAIHRAEINGQTVEWSGNTYRSALETIVRQIKPEFYYDNYDSLFKENQAQFIGLQKALVYIKALSPKLYELYDEHEMIDRLQGYADKMNDDRDMTFGSVTARGDSLVDMICRLYIKDHPEQIKEFPILQRAYNEDGRKKDIIQLLQDRQALIDSGQANAKTDELYETIANYRNYEKGELRGELDALDEYVAATGTDDEFVFQLIEQRLGRTTLDEQVVAKYMEDTRRQAEIARGRIQSEAELKEIEKEEQEIAPREEESIKDEVGDQFEPKTEGQKQEEVQVEAMWQNRFQSWDRNSVNLPNGAKRKEEAVRVMQDIERERREQDREQQMKDNEQEHMQR